MGGLSTHQGYDRDFFLLAESDDHSTMSDTVAVIGGFGNIQPSEAYYSTD